MGILDGKTAVITGGTRGLGLAIAQVYAKEGAAVVVASRTQSAVDQAVALLTAVGARAAGMTVDVSDLAQVEALAAFALDQFGRLDIWVNNAGMAGPYGPTMGNAPRDFRQVVGTNILGMYHGSWTAMRHFLAQRSGKLINILGRGSSGPVAWQNAYASSKAWARSFTQSLAHETRGSGVGVYAFNPGMVLTDLLTNVEVITGSEDRLKQFPTVLRMWARPPEIAAQKALWIASSATDGKTGLLVNSFTPWVALQGALKEGLRALLKRPIPEQHFTIKSIPPYQD